MLEHENVPTADAAQARVSAKDLTEALAALDVRQARQDYDQADTVTLAEGIQGCSTEATPEELQAEVETIREADAVREKVKRRQRRLRLVLVSELVSTALSFTVLFGLHQTIYNPSWQQARQAKDFQQKLTQSLGPSPKYQIWVVPESSRFFSGSQTVITSFGDWTKLPAYPLYCLPDGCNIHHFDGLDDEGHNGFGMAGFMPYSAAYIEFRQPQALWFRDNMTVFYDGLAYWRGRVLRTDIPAVLHGKAFTLYPALAADPKYHVGDTVPLTVSMQSIQAAHGQGGQAYPELYDTEQFADGQQVHLDSHAWESYSP